MAVRIAAIAWLLAGLVVPVATFAAVLGAEEARVTTVVVAAEDIPAGTLITSDMLATMSLQVVDVAPNAYEAVSLVIGNITRSDVLTGQLITSDVLASATAPRAAVGGKDPAGSALDAAALGLLAFSLPSFLLAWSIGMRHSHGAAAIGVLLAAVGLLVGQVVPAIAGWREAASLPLALTLLVVSAAAWRSAAPSGPESPSDLSVVADP